MDFLYKKSFFSLYPNTLQKKVKKEHTIFLYCFFIRYVHVNTRWESGKADASLTRGGESEEKKTTSEIWNHSEWEDGRLIHHFKRKKKKEVSFRGDGFVQLYSLYHIPMLIISCAPQRPRTQPQKSLKMTKYS